MECACSQQGGFGDCSTFQGSHCWDFFGGMLDVSSLDFTIIHKYHHGDFIEILPSFSSIYFQGFSGSFGVLCRPRLHGSEALHHLRILQQHFPWRTCIEKPCTLVHLSYWYWTEAKAAYVNDAQFPSKIVALQLMTQEQTSRRRTCDWHNPVLAWWNHQPAVQCMWTGISTSMRYFHVIIIHHLLHSFAFHLCIPSP